MQDPLVCASRCCAHLSARCGVAHARPRTSLPRALRCHSLGPRDPSGRCAHLSARCGAGSTQTHVAFHDEGTTVSTMMPTQCCLAPFRRSGRRLYPRGPCQITGGMGGGAWSSWSVNWGHGRWGLKQLVSQLGAWEMGCGAAGQIPCCLYQDWVARSGTTLVRLMPPQPTCTILASSTAMRATRSTCAGRQL